jgi:serine/threonine-protein kinase
VDVDVDVVIRDPRDETRKTPIPTRPGESIRRIHREEPRRAAAAPVRSRKRSFAWLFVSLLLLLVAGAAVVVAFPYLEHLLPFKRSKEARPQLAVPIPRTPLPGPPSTAGAGREPSNLPGAPTAAAPPAEARDAEPVAPSLARPDVANAKAASQAAEPDAPGSAPATPEAAPSAEEEDDMFVPLATPQSPTRKAPPARASKRGPRSKEAVELQREWNGTRSAYDALTREQSCENPKIGIFCRRFADIKAEMDSLGDGYKRDLHNKAKKLRRDLEKQLNPGQ